MAIGERIKRIRNFRKLTQGELGAAVGLSDVRIRQYELGNRTPKEDTVMKLANALNCNYKNLTESNLYAAEDVIYTLFELDEHYDLSLHSIKDSDNEPHTAISFNYSLLDDFLNSWRKKKEELDSGIITREEYFEWKINWPNSDK